MRGMVFVCLLPMCTALVATDVRDTGAIADDERDDTAAFVEAAGKGVVHVPRGTFICNGATFTNSVTFVGEPDSVITRTEATPIFRFVGKSSVVSISGIKFDGAGLAKRGISAGDLASFSVTNCEVVRCGAPGYSQGRREPIDGIFMTGVEQATVARCRFAACERDGVLGWPVQRMRVENCFAADCGRSGFASDRSDHDGPVSVTFINNVVTNCGSIGLYTESVSNKVCVIQITGNRIINCGADDWEYGWGIAAGNYTAGRIEENTILNFGQGGKAPNYGNGIGGGDNAGDLIIARNKIVRPRRVGILINNTRDPKFKVTIEGNEIDDPGEQAIYIYKAPKGEVIGNQIRNPKKQGVLVHWSSGSKVISNKVSRTALMKDEPIETRLSFGVTQRGNDVVDQRESTPAAPKP